MSENELREWLKMRGVRDEHLDAMVAQYAGWTEDELDALYEEMHT